MVSATSVEISWIAPHPATRNGIITEYRISVVEVDTGTQQDYVASRTSLVVQSLHPYYTYHFSVSAHTVQTGPFSAVEVFQTPQDSEYFRSQVNHIQWNRPPSGNETLAFIEERWTYVSLGF